MNTDVGIALVGLGQIGLALLRQMIDDNSSRNIRVVADIKDPKSILRLLQHSSAYGKFRYPIEYCEQTRCFKTSAGNINFVDMSQAQGMKWSDLGVSIVIDATGRATKRPIAEEHLAKGADYVLVSAPPSDKEDCDAILLYGINHEQFDPAIHRIVSMASCTTNCLAPIVKIIHKLCGIATGFFTTTHAYTNTQVLVDSPAKDLADSWGAADNIIISTSRAAKSIGWIFPELKDKILGKADRIPVLTGSTLNFYPCVIKPPVNIAALEAMLRIGAETVGDTMKILEPNEVWPSTYFIGDTHSCIVRTDLLKILGHQLQIVAWYDNVWGYATNLRKIAGFMTDEIAYATSALNAF